MVPVGHVVGMLSQIELPFSAMKPVNEPLHYQDRRGHPAARPGPILDLIFDSVPFASLVLRFSWLTVSWVDSVGC